MFYFSEKLLYLLEMYKGKPISADNIVSLEIIVYDNNIVGVVKMKKRLPSFFDEAIYVGRG